MKPPPKASSPASSEKLRTARRTRCGAALGRWGEPRVGKRRAGEQQAVADERRIVGLRFGDAEAVAQQRRQRGEQRAHRGAGILQRVVPREYLGALAVGGGGRQDRLLERLCPAAIGALRIQHAEERRRGERPARFEQRQREPAGGGERG